MFTFAVVGHNEAPLLATAVRQAMEAVEPGDGVWFVDSESSDDSAAVAESLGAEVVAAPLGKGRAMAAALERCREGHLCFLDADIEGSSSNIALALREAAERDDPDMAVGDFEWPGKRFAGAIDGMYLPLVQDLFPDVLDVAPKMPFSGFRVLRAGLETGPLPARWGAETYLNVHLTALGKRVTTVELGVYAGPDRLKTTELGWEIAEVILDLAERHGRLNPAMRPSWEDWVREAMAVLATQPDVGEPARDYPERLAEVARRPRPGAQ